MNNYVALLALGLLLSGCNIYEKPQINSADKKSGEEQIKVQQAKAHEKSRSGDEKGDCDVGSSNSNAVSVVKVVNSIVNKKGGLSEKERKF